MMIKKEQLELVAVNYDESGKKATLVFLDEDAGEIRELAFNRQAYDTASGKFIDSVEKSERVDVWCDEQFGLTFDTLTKAIGTRKDIFCYEKFNSLFEMSQVTKFEPEMEGQILNVVVSEILDDGTAIKIRFEYEGETYESKMGYSEYIESLRKWFVDPIKKAKQTAKFYEKFGITVENMQDMVGKTVMVEVKKALGRYMWCEVKPFAKAKKK